MKTQLTIIIAFLFIGLSYGQDGKPADFKIIDNQTINSQSYSIYAKSDAEKFTLKVCQGTQDDCPETGEFIIGVDSTVFFNAFTAFIKAEFDDGLVSTSLSAGESNAIKDIPNKIKAVEQKKVDDQLSDAQKLLRDIDENKNQYSGLLVLNKEAPYKITYFDIDKVKEDKRDNWDGGEDYPSRYATTEEGTDVLEIKNALVTFFNNKASTVYVEAELKYGDGTSEEIIFLNSQFSVPIRYFNYYGSTVSKNSERKENGKRITITIDYNDVFDYKSDQFFNYSVANSQVKLSNVEGSKYSSTAKVIQRRFFDFFTGIIYSDLMGFNTENSNALLNAQARLLIPLNLRNIGKWSLGRQFITSTNVALSNSFEDENRFIAVTDDESFSNFELLRRNNLFGKIGLEVITHEAKGWFTNISLGYSVAFYGTGFRYTQTQDGAEDMVINKQILSVAHGPFLNFEIRPQNNFGADVTFSIEDLNYSDSGTIGNRSFRGDIINEAGKDHFVMPFNLINIEASFYWLTNPETAKGGIYARLGSYFHTESNSIFPQFMVGYATNLTSFVNKFKTNTNDLKGEDEE